MDDMKVLFNTWSAAFFIKGGGEVQLLESQKHLEEKGINIELYNMWKPQTEFEIFHQFSSVPGVEYCVDSYQKLNKKIAISTIYWNENLTQEYPLHFHFRNLFQKADILLTNSDAESEQIANLFDIPKEKLHKTRNSITKDYFDLKTTKNFRELYNIEGKFILTIANIDERKNTVRLMEACEKLGITLVLIGSIRHEDQFAKIQDSKYLKYLGPISDVDILKSAYQNCELFILPSMCETPGIAALEAGSQGSKIVITEIGSTGEYFKDFVTYVNPWYAQSIQEGIEKELNTKRDDSLSKHIISNYTWDKTADDIIAGYKKILN